MQGMFGGGGMHGMHGMGGMGGGMHGGMGGFGGFTRPMNWNALGKMGDIDAKVQNHLLKVYATLCSGIMAAALGVYVDAKFAVAGLMTQIALLVSIVGLNFITGEACRSVTELMSLVAPSVCWQLRLTFFA